MAEEEVNYASVVFKTKKHSPPEAKKEETVYDEVKVGGETTGQTGDTNISAGSLPHKNANSRCYQRLACGLGILCVLLVLGIIAFIVHLTTLNQESELNRLKENQTSLLAVNHNLKNLNQKLSSENENLRRDHNNLTQSYAASESKIQNLTAEKQQLKKQIQELKTQIQDLETQKNNLTETIQDMETKWNEQNVSRAQWSINAYCLVNEGRQCQACQKGWIHDQSSCYVINNANAADLKTWDEAQADCKGKNSDLAVIVNKAEKTFISEHSWNNGGLNEYWIGLRAENGKWKWVDGSDLTESSWIQQPATDGLCAVSVYEEGLKSASCGGKKRWICKKKALTV